MCVHLDLTDFQIKIMKKYDMVTTVYYFELPTGVDVVDERRLEKDINLFMKSTHGIFFNKWPTPFH